MRSLALVLVLSVARGAFAEPLSLAEALQRAHDHRPSLKVSAAQVEAARSRERETVSPWLPQVSLALGYSRSTANFVARPGTLPSTVSSTSALSAQSYDFFTSSLNAQQLIWDFGQVWNRWDATKANTESQVQAQRAALVGADLEVRTAYFTAAAQRDLVAVARATLANSEAHFAQVEAFVKVGTRPDIDLAQARADRASARLALLNAQNAATSARARLTAAMGLDSANDWDLTDDAPGTIDLEGQGLEFANQAAVAARPELQSFDAQVRAQELTLRSLRASYWPTLSATAGLTVQARSLDLLTPNGSLGLNLNWPFYQGGQTNAQIATAEATLVQLEAQRDLARQQVHLDVEQALLDVAAGRESVAVSQELFEAAREQQRLAEARYNAGAGSMLEWADAQVKAAAAAAQQVQARFTLATARARLLAALGR